MKVVFKSTGSDSGTGFVTGSGFGLGMPDLTPKLLKKSKNSIVLGGWSNMA